LFFEANKQEFRLKGVETLKKHVIIQVERERFQVSSRHACVEVGCVKGEENLSVTIDKADGSQKERR